MKAYFLLLLTATIFTTNVHADGATPAFADEGIVIRFEREIQLAHNGDAQKYWVTSRFDKKGSFKMSEPDGNALRGCLVNAYTRPNTSRVIPIGRKYRLFKRDNQEQEDSNLPSYLATDPETAQPLLVIQCFKHAGDEPNILSKLREYLGAVPDSGDPRAEPIRLQQQGERAQLLQPLLKEEIKTAEEAVEL